MPTWVPVPWGLRAADCVPQRHLRRSRWPLILQPVSCWVVLPKLWNCAANHLPRWVLLPRRRRCPSCVCRRKVQPLKQLHQCGQLPSLHPGPGLHHCWGSCRWCTLHGRVLLPRQRNQLVRWCGWRPLAPAMPLWALLHRGLTPARGMPSRTILRLLQQHKPEQLHSVRRGALLQHVCPNPAHWRVQRWVLLPLWCHHPNAHRGHHACAERHLGRGSDVHWRWCLPRRLPVSRWHRCTHPMRRWHLQLRPGVQ